MGCHILRITDKELGKNKQTSMVDESWHNRALDARPSDVSNSQQSSISGEHKRASESTDRTRHLRLTVVNTSNQHGESNVPRMLQIKGEVVIQSLLEALAITAAALFLLWLLVKHIQFRIYRKLDVWNKNRGDYVSFVVPNNETGDNHASHSYRRE